MQIRNSDFELRLTTDCHYIQRQIKKHDQNNALSTDLALEIHASLFQRRALGGTKLFGCSARAITGSLCQERPSEEGRALIRPSKQTSGNYHYF
jgi:hypothetical protein